MARLVSVNVGLPRDVAWRGQTVRTAVWKEPVTGRRPVTRLNVAGDGQADLAGHGGENRAVMVYQLDSYRHWEKHLGRADFTFGQFGENFTVDGLADDEVCIGDRYRIGTALFEVSQPRVTCYRVGIRMDEPSMAAFLVSVPIANPICDIYDVLPHARKLPVECPAATWNLHAHAGVRPSLFGDHRSEWGRLGVGGAPRWSQRSGGAPFVPVMKSTDLRYRDNGSALRRLHGSRFRRVLAE
jgi:hypothetical protein